MINYSSYNDVWGIKPEISENFNYNNFNNSNQNISNQNISNQNISSQNDLKKIETFKKEETVNLNENNQKTNQENFNELLNDDKFLKELKARLDIKDKKQSSIEKFTNGFDNFIDNMTNYLCSNLRFRFLLSLFIFVLFLISCFYIVVNVIINPNRITKSEFDDTIVTLTQAMTNAANGDSMIAAGDGAEIAAAAAFKHFINKKFITDLNDYVIIPKKLLAPRN